MPSIDLNADVGESFGSWSMGDDAAIFGSVSSANIACGFHAGDPSTIATTARAAVTASITIGAHVGYRDLVGFGRRFIDASPTELADDVLYQLGALSAMARAAGGSVKYVKPHGALYNAIVHHEAQARAVIDGIRAFGGELPVLLLPGSIALELADKAGLRGVTEAFADRNYTPEGTLVPRRDPDALQHDPEAATVNMLRMVTEGRVKAVDGSLIPMKAESICVHSDAPGAVALASHLRAALEDAGVRINGFA
ncbi:LamB/YcsF family protein [Paeniglutamicibacter cryotolerans]|uniref:5-oxoprolinase subunit A n=1 Tax=Paeniglutamicibacter cryotolerans TaxID=670079 RepID=A0A839QRD4_9MICC|nr:5-oxoprolinase subunit PxpA [Paeniglutamicibacter cryotolerans]MBB2994631.1 UPF0271 protein [Paeniglutamicibacter cryotolerans]